jgi:hypothetical protein
MPVKVILGKIFIMTMLLGTLSLFVNRIREMVKKKYVKTKFFGKISKKDNPKEYRLFLISHFILIIAVIYLMVYYLYLI